MYILTYNFVCLSAIIHSTLKYFIRQYRATKNIELVRMFKSRDISTVLDSLYQTLFVKLQGLSGSLELLVGICQDATRISACDFLENKTNPRSTNPLMCVVAQKHQVTHHCTTYGHQKLS